MALLHVLFRGVARSIPLEIPSEVKSNSQELLVLELAKVASFTVTLKERGTYEISCVFLKFSLTAA